MAYYDPADDAEEELKQFFGGVKRFLPRRGEWAVVSLHGWPLAQHKPTGWYIEPKWTRTKGLIYRGVAPDEYGLYAGLHEHKSVTAAFREIMKEIDRLDVPHKRNPSRKRNPSGSRVLREFGDELTTLVCYTPKGVIRPFSGESKQTQPVGFNLAGTTDSATEEAQRAVALADGFVRGVLLAAAGALGERGEFATEEIEAAPPLTADPYDRDDLIGAYGRLAAGDTRSTSQEQKGATLAGRAARDAVKSAWLASEYALKAEAAARRGSSLVADYEQQAKAAAIETVYLAVACAKAAIEGGVRPAQVRALALAVGNAR
jgi:hypothetical protein